MAYESDIPIQDEKSPMPKDAFLIVDRHETTAGQIEKRFQILTETISELDDCAARLINRINPILNQEARGEDPGVNSSPNANSIIVNQLDTNIGRLRHILTTIADVNNRVEL